jgi:hypothetical protein
MADFEGQAPLLKHGARPKPVQVPDLEAAFL